MRSKSRYEKFSQYVSMIFNWYLNAVDHVKSEGQVATYLKIVFTVFLVSLEAVLLHTKRSRALTLQIYGIFLWNNKKRSHTQLDSRKQVIAFQDRVITINIKEAQHPLKWEKQVIDKSSIMLKISTKSMHRVLVWEIGPANNTTRCSRLSKRRLLHAWHQSQLAIDLSTDKSKWQIHVNNKSD